MRNLFLLDLHGVTQDGSNLGKHQSRGLEEPELQGKIVRIAGWSNGSFPDHDPGRWQSYISVNGGMTSRAWGQNGKSPAEVKFCGRFYIITPATKISQALR